MLGTRASGWTSSLRSASLGGQWPQLASIGADAVFLRSDKRACVDGAEGRGGHPREAERFMQMEASARYYSRGKRAFRTLIAPTNASYGIKLDGNHFLMPHLVRYCGSTLSRCVRGPDGRTTYERRKEPCNVASLHSPRWCSVGWQRRQSPLHALRSDGLKASSSACGTTATKCSSLTSVVSLRFAVCHVWRLGSRYNKEVLVKCSARPWDRLVRSDPRAVSIKLLMIAPVPSREAARDIQKRLFIKESDLTRTATLPWFQGSPKSRSGKDSL